MTTTAANPTVHAPGRRTSIANKLALAVTALIIVVTTFVYITLTRNQRENLLGAKETAASAVSRLFADWCVAGVVFDDDNTIKEALTTLGRNDEIEYAAVWVVDGTGKVGRQLGQLQRGPAENVTAVAQNTRLKRENNRVVVVSPVRDQAGKVVAMAVVAFSLIRENAAIAGVVRTTLFISIAVALGFILVLRWITRVAISTPLSKLVLAAKQLEEGRGGDLDVHSSDEVGQLAHGFRNMATAIRVREERINTGNRNMRLVLDNVGQGFITLDNEGTMSADRARVVDEWFGVADGQLKFWDYLRRIDGLVGEWFELGWMAICDNALPLVLCLEQLPALIQKAGRTFELAYRPIVEGERLAKLIVVITEVTARIERQRAEEAQREMMSIFRRILSDRIAIDEFFLEAKRLVAALTADLPAGHQTVDPAPFDPILLKRQVHTLKGNCALFGIESIANLCHAFEDRLSESPEPLSSKEKQSLQAHWDKVNDMYTGLANGRSGNAVELDRPEYEAFVSALGIRLGQDLLVTTAMTWQFEPGSKRLATVAEQIRRLADRLGRASVDTVCEPTNVRLPPRKWGPFWSTFTHLVRNTVDHGVEASAERVAAGKPGRATVTLGLDRNGNEVVVSIRDDGPGIDWPKIQHRAKQRGLAHATPADLEEALFFEGISSRDSATSTSGRGVGLGAVRHLVRELGGRVEIQTEAGHGTTLRCFLPQAMLFDDNGVAENQVLPVTPHQAETVSTIIPKAVSGPPSI